MRVIVIYFGFWEIELGFPPRSSLPSFFLRGTYQFICLWYVRNNRLNVLNVLNVLIVLNHWNYINHQDWRGRKDWEIKNQSIVANRLWRMRKLQFCWFQLVVTALMTTTSHKICKNALILTHLQILFRNNCHFSYFVCHFKSHSHFHTIYVHRWN